MNIRILVVGVLFLLPATCLAQRLIGSVNDTQRIVISTNDGPVSTQGIDIHSAGGLLIPATDFAPFEFLLINNEREVAMGSIGENVILDGELNTTVGYTGDPLTGDLRVYYGDGPRAVEMPIQVGDQQVIGDGYLPSDRPPIDPNPNLFPRRLVINDDYKFVIVGEGELTGFRLASPNNWLVPATMPDPFESTPINTTGEIVFETSSPVSVDGEVVLSAGWNPSARWDDISAELTNGDRTQFLSPRYPRPEDNVTIGVNENNRFTLTGDGVPLVGFSVRSRSGPADLIPATDAGPFQQLDANSTSNISYYSPTETVTLDGELVLSAGWNQSPGSYVTATYTVEQNSTSFTRSFHGPRIPEVAPDDYSSIFWDIDDEGNFVLIGDGQSILGVDIESASGNIRTLSSADSTGPFDLLLRNDPEQVTIVALPGETSVIDGQHVLMAGWDMQSDLDFSVQVGHPDGYAFDIRRWNPNDLDAIEVIISDEGEIILSGAGQQLVGLSIESVAGGLTPTDDHGPFQFLLSNHEGNVTFGSLAATAVLAGNFATGVFVDSSVLSAEDLSIQVGGAAADSVLLLEVPAFGAIVPEPSASLLVGVGLLGLFGMRRKRVLLKRRIE